MILKSYGQLSSLREVYLDKRIALCNGAFDLIHAGHVLFFEDCKKYADILVVGVAEDALIRRNKGEQRPILNECVRLKMIDSLKPVDYCYLDRLDVVNGEQPLKVLENIFSYLRPDLYIVNEDTFDMPYREKIVASHKIEMMILTRYCPSEFKNISTSQIIEKIKSLP